MRAWTYSARKPRPTSPLRDHRLDPRRRLGVGKQDLGRGADILRILAAQGYTTVGVDYSIAPGRSAIRCRWLQQANDALRYLQANAARLGVQIDHQRIVLAGDSAGRLHIAAQLGLSSHGHQSRVRA